MSGLSAKQIAVLRALRDHGTLGARALGSYVDTSGEGVAMTAASLVRRGHVERLRVAGHVAYRITDSGRMSLVGTAGVPS